MKKKRCGNCGSFEIRKKKTSGPFPWKDYASIYLNHPVEVTSCEKCGETMGDLADSAQIDTSIEQTIRENVKDFISRILENEECQQIDLAGRVGITPEHLSTLKSGSKIPGFQTYNFLKILSFNHEAFEIADPKLDVDGLKQASA
jgi:hypothetical protein